VAHACNPSYSGGRDQETCGSKPAQANSSTRPYLENKTLHKNGADGVLKMNILSSSSSTTKKKEQLLLQRQPKVLKNYMSELPLLLVSFQHQKSNERHSLIYSRSPMRSGSGGGWAMWIQEALLASSPQGSKELVATLNVWDRTSLIFQLFLFEPLIVYTTCQQVCRFDAIICKLLVSPVQIITNMDDWM
jgi:hypothetical protein